MPRNQQGRFKNGLRREVLKTLLPHRHGLPAGRVRQEVLSHYGATPVGIDVTLSVGVREGYVAITDKRCCDFCGSTRHHYRITQKGKAYIQDFI